MDAYNDKIEYDANPYSKQKVQKGGNENRKNRSVKKESEKKKIEEGPSVFVDENDAGHITMPTQQKPTNQNIDERPDEVINEVRNEDHLTEHSTEAVNGSHDDDRDGIASSIPKICMKPGSSDISDSDEVGEEENVLVEENRRALPAYAPTYELEKFEKKALIIFNHINITGNVDQPYKPRKGTERDVIRLTQTFGRFGFDVVEYEDLTRKAIFDTIDGFCKNYSDYGCVAVAVLTHGGDNGVLRAKDKKYYEREIISHFKNYQRLSLITKPLILIIQACRGTDSIKGVRVTPTNDSEPVHHDNDNDEPPYYLPLEADTLVLHSSYYGKPSHRHTKRGSWFIQTLCNEINKHAYTYDLERIMVMVKMRVAINCQHKVTRSDNVEDVNKQMPVVTSTLFRLLFLRKYGDPSPNVDLPPSLPRITSTDELDNSVSAVQVRDYFRANERIQHQNCSCIETHFDYIRQCLGHFVEEHPRDPTARALLNLANCKHNSDEEQRKNTLIIMSNYLENQCRHFKYHKFLYFFRDDLRNSIEKDEIRKNNEFTFRNIHNYILVGVFACVSTAVIFGIMKR